MEITRDHRIAVVQRLLKDGKTVTEVAKLVGISRRSVDRYAELEYNRRKIGGVKNFFDGEKWLIGPQETAKPSAKAKTSVVSKVVAAVKSKLPSAKNKQAKAIAVPETPKLPAVYKLVQVNKTITVIKDGKPKTADRTHRNIEQIKEAVKQKNYEEAYNLIDARTGVKVFSNGLVEVLNGTVIFQGRQVEDNLGVKIVQMVTEHKEYAAKALSAFLVKVSENPDPVATSRLFDFCEANDIEIDEEGYVLAWKKVRSDYMDIHSGSMDNSPGKTLTMERSRCNSDPNQTCAAGLHVCSLSYLPNFGGGGGNRILQVRVHPKDFVAIPPDYGNAKARTCEYYVVKDVTDVAAERIKAKEWDNK